MGLTLGDLESLRTHLLGIGGIGVSALARMLRDGGLGVSGCDVRASSLTRALEAEGIPVRIGHSVEHLKDCDVVVYSTAVPAGNPEMEAASAAGKRVLHRSELLSLLVDTRATIGVTGTNGKGTVTSMITWILESAGYRPSYYIGAMCPNLGTNARYRKTEHMVAELDESDGSLVNIHPRFALLNNLEMDHLNYYKSIEHAVDTLHTFFTRLPDGAAGFFNADCDGAMQVAAGLPNLRKITFGKAEAADYRYTPVSFCDQRSCFGMQRCNRPAHAVGKPRPSGFDEPVEPAMAGLGPLPPGGRGSGAPTSADLGQFCLVVPGAYNIENAAGAVAVCSELGVPVEEIRKALACYQGLENRYTVVTAGKCQVVKDYISHPTGIRKVLSTARLGGPSRIVAVFKPYRYTMIRYHAENYAAAFALADETVVTDMWAGGEEPIPGVDTSWLAEQMRAGGAKVTHVPDMGEIAGYIVSKAAPGDCFVFFGGQDLFEVAEKVARTLQGGDT